MLEFTKRADNEPYIEHFKVGDTVKCLCRIKFMDGTVHEKYSVHEITKEDVCYFNMMHRDYELV